MKPRSFFTALATVVIALLLVGASGFYWLFAQNPLSLLAGAPATNPAAAIFVPKYAPLLASLLVNPDRLESLRQAVVPPQARRQSRAELTQLKQSLLADTGLDYAQDVQPWLGDELTLAVTALDLDRDEGNGQQPGYLLVLTSHDPERSREFLQLFWQKRAIAGADLVFEQYKGVKLIYGSAAVAAEGQRQQAKTQTAPFSLTAPFTSASLASAAVGDRFILFANSPKVLRDAITNVQAPELSLSSASFYQRSLETLTQPRLGLVFANLTGLETWIEESVTVKPAPTPPLTAPPSAAGQTLAIALQLSQQGILAATALQSPEITGTTIAPLAQPVTALQHIPAATPLVLAGSGLDRRWADLSAGWASSNPLAQLANQTFTELQTRWQIDLMQEVFPWVTGEYALALLPPELPSRSAASASEADWIFVAQTVDAAATAQGIAHLDDRARQQGLSVGLLRLGDRTVSAWTRLSAGSASKRSTQMLQAEVRGVHVTVGNYEILTSSLAAMDAALNAVDRSLLSNEQFQQAVAALAQPNHGYVYLDWHQSQPWLERQFPVVKVVELAASPLLKHLRSLTLSSDGTQSGIQHSGLFLNLS